MYELQEKQWGWSKPEVISSLCVVHRIDVRQGGHCSWHKHEFKDNVFSAARGRLLIEYHIDNGDIEQVVLQPGDSFTVPAGVVHRFRAPFEAVMAFEVYYPRSSFEHVDPNDIIRFSEGGFQ